MDNLPHIPTNSTLVESSSSPGENDGLDPRIQIELERLNHANEAINHLELQLDEARKTLKELWNTSVTELSQLERTIGSAVSKARNYYDIRIKLRDAKEIVTKAKHRFERAQALHVAAKELALVSVDYIDAAEKSNENTATWNETYQHAVVQAADAEREKYQADFDQQRAERVYFDLEKTLERLQKDYGRSINKSQPYYQMKAEYHKELEFQKRKIYGLENCVNEAKSQYQKSLKNLERISNEIHAQRKQEHPSYIGENETIEMNLLTCEITPTISQPTNHRPNTTFRSCLLRTEGLPPGIITSTHLRYASEDEEITTTNNLNNQFILRTKEAPYSILINHSEVEEDDSLQRVASFSSQKSQATDDSDDKTGSLHVLSDEQLDHLAYDYHSYPAEFSYSTDAIDDLLLQLENSTLQAKTFFRKLFKADSIPD